MASFWRLRPLDIIVAFVATLWLLAVKGIAEAFNQGTHTNLHAKLITRKSQ